MIKIGILDLTLSAVLGGSVTWAMAIIDGLHKLNIDSDLITFTKTGKIPKKIQNYKNLKIIKYDEVVAQKELNKYNVIILNCQGNGIEDKKDFKAGIYPKWLKILEKFNGKLFLQMHSTYSMTKSMYPFTEDLINLKCFNNLFFIGEKLYDTYKEEGMFVNNKPKFFNRLPFITDQEYDFSNKKDKIIFVGRVGKSKGTDIFLNISNMFPYMCEIWGPIQGFSMFEVKNSSIYMGEYQSYNDLKAIIGSSKVMVIPTRQRRNEGFLHYVALEALYFGAIPIYPENWNFKSNEFYSGLINPFNCDFFKVSEFINDTLKLSDKNLQDILINNHEYVVKNHSSKEVAKDLLNFVGV